jgi:hypothetical protein
MTGIFFLECLLKLEADMKVHFHFICAKLYRQICPLIIHYFTEAGVQGPASPRQCAVAHQRESSA